MSLETPVGLRRFPVTKLCMVTGIVVPVVAALTETKYVFKATYDPFIKEYGQYYRYLTYQLSSVNETDVALIVLLFYQYRQLERLFGNEKYLSMLAMLIFYQGLATVSVHLLFNNLVGPWLGTQWNELASGAFGVVIGLFHFYKQYTPIVYEFDIVLGAPLWSQLFHKGVIRRFDNENKIMKVRLNDQFMVNVLVIILICNQGAWGPLQALVAWLSGLFLDIGILPGLDKWRVPFAHYMLFGEVKRLEVGSTSANTSASLGGNSVTQLANNSASSQLEEDNENDEPNDEPARPLGVQFLDAFRR
ncbi:putative membrane protein [Nakaseomyces glabratus]|nr:hypothetical protein J6894_03369 [Nakaseomyces glabratus]KAI8394408.1 hypothetical protein J6895_03412 [Nakaseomyces glabratus]KAJ9572430.1 hypothetical protein LTX96_0000622 [Nakaseomyces glabratus]KTB21691.1 putative membrane protein [Nakaseomyces glabratus]KTB24929.1 putative membrane protein [Nakaseomyces glabratus]